MGIDVVMMTVPLQEPTEERVLKWSFELAQSMSGTGFLWMDSEEKYGGQHRALDVVKLGDDREYMGSKPPPAYHGYSLGLTSPWDSVLEVSTMHRYYGPGYERGPWASIRACGDWLQHNVGPTFYGGDSGDSLGPWEREATVCQAHWLRHGHKPYRMPSVRYPDRFKLDCAFCKEPMAQNMWAGDLRGGMTCIGCGKYQETLDGGKTWGERES